MIDAGAIEVHGITNEFLADKPRFADLVGPDGRLLTGSPDGDSPGNTTSSEGARKALEGSSGFHITERSDRVLEVYEHVNTWDVGMVIQMRASEAESGLNVIRLTAAASGAIVAGALLVIAVILSKNLNRDLGTLVSWSKGVGEGEWDAPLELGATDEFKELENSLENMVRDMVKHQSQLRKAERRFSSLFINSLDPVYIARSDGRIVELKDTVEGFKAVVDGNIKAVQRAAEELVTE